MNCVLVCAKLNNIHNFHNVNKGKSGVNGTDLEHQSELWLIRLFWRSHKTFRFNLNVSFILFSCSYICRESYCVQILQKNHFSWYDIIWYFHLWDQVDVSSTWKFLSLSKLFYQLSLNYYRINLKETNSRFFNLFPTYTKLVHGPMLQPFSFSFVAFIQF